jgi:hypothetical protein
VSCHRLNSSRSSVTEWPAYLPPWASLRTSYVKKFPSSKKSLCLLPRTKARYCTISWARSILLFSHQHICMIQFNIILLFTHRSPKWPHASMFQSHEICFPRCIAYPHTYER